MFRTTTNVLPLAAVVFASPRHFHCTDKLVSRPSGSFLKIQITFCVYANSVLRTHKLWFVCTHFASTVETWPPAKLNVHGHTSARLHGFRGKRQLPSARHSHVSKFWPPFRLNILSSFTLRASQQGVSSYSSDTPIFHCYCLLSLLSRFPSPIIIANDTVAIFIMQDDLPTRQIIPSVATQKLPHAAKSELDRPNTQEPHGQGRKPDVG